jgi:hypothetical protein
MAQTVGHHPSPGLAEQFQLRAPLDGGEGAGKRQVPKPFNSINLKGNIAAAQEHDREDFFVLPR